MSDQYVHRLWHGTRPPGVPCHNWVSVCEPSTFRDAKWLLSGSERLNLKTEQKSNIQYKNSICRNKSIAWKFEVISTRIAKMMSISKCFVSLLFFSAELLAFSLCCVCIVYFYRVALQCSNTRFFFCNSMHLNKYFQFHLRIAVRYNSLDRHWALMHCKMPSFKSLEQFQNQYCPAVFK